MTAAADIRIAFDTTERRHQPDASGNPYKRMPEREQWKTWTTYERPDRTQYTLVHERCRWAGSYSEPRLIDTIENPETVPCLKRRTAAAEVRAAERARVKAERAREEAYRREVRDEATRTRLTRLAAGERAAMRSALGEHLGLYGAQLTIDALDYLDSLEQAAA